MTVLAHIGKIPVEEWLPFVVPVVALYVYGRRRERRRRRAVAQLPDPAHALDQGVVDRITDAWAQASHGDVSSEHLILFYPPGPDGMSAEELAQRVHSPPQLVEHQLEQLEDLNYLELADRDGEDERRAWLTFRGYELLETTERELLAAFASSDSEPGSHPGAKTAARPERAHGSRLAAVVCAVAALGFWVVRVSAGESVAVTIGASLFTVVALALLLLSRPR